MTQPNKYNWDKLFKDYFPVEGQSGKIIADGYQSWHNRVGYENRGTSGELFYCPKDYLFLNSVSYEIRESLMDYVQARCDGEGYQGDPEAELKKLGVIE